MTKFFAIAAAAIVVTIAGANIAKADYYYDNCGGYKTQTYTTYTPQTYFPVVHDNYNYNYGY